MTSSVKFPCGRSSERSYFLSKCVILRRLPKVSWLLKDSNQNACDTSHGQSMAGQYRAGQCGAGPCRARSMQGQGQRRSRVNTGQGRLVSPGQGRRRSRWRVNTAGRHVHTAGRFTQQGVRFTMQGTRVHKSRQQSPKCWTGAGQVQHSEQGRSKNSGQGQDQNAGQARTQMQGAGQGRAGEVPHVGQVPNGGPDAGQRWSPNAGQGLSSAGKVQCKAGPVQRQVQRQGSGGPPTSSCWTWTIVPTTIDGLWRLPPKRRGIQQRWQGPQAGPEEATYPELVRPGSWARQVVLALGVGRRWSQEARTFVQLHCCTPLQHRCSNSLEVTVPTGLCRQRSGISTTQSFFRGPHRRCM